MMAYKKKMDLHLQTGAFTKKAKKAGKGVQAYAKQVVKSPTATTKTKRQAQFAINASKWKHTGRKKKK